MLITPEVSFHVKLSSLVYRWNHRTCPWAVLQDPKHIRNMPRKKPEIILTQPVREGVKTFKVRLDARTVITLSSKKAFEVWKERYPKAVIIS